MNIPLNRLASILQQRNIEVTDKRIDILRVILDQSESFTIQTVYQELVAQEVALSLSVVTSTLQLFAFRGIIEEDKSNEGDAVKPTRGRRIIKYRIKIS